MNVLKMNGVLRLTPELTDALSYLCDEEILSVHAEALDKMEDFLLNHDPEQHSSETIAMIITLRDTRKLLLSILSAMTTLEDCPEDDEC